MRTQTKYCYGKRWKVIAKGKAIILALSEVERNRIFKQLDGYEREMFNRISRTVYVSR